MVNLSFWELNDAKLSGLHPFKYGHSWVKNGAKTERKWDNNPWSIFCDPHWELIWCNKWHPGTSEKSTPPEIAVGTDFHGGHETKTTLFFLPANGVTSWLPPLHLVSLTSDSTVQPQNTYTCIKVTSNCCVFFMCSFLCAFIVF